MRTQKPLRIKLPKEKQKKEILLQKHSFYPQKSTNLAPSDLASRLQLP